MLSHDNYIDLLESRNTPEMKALEPEDGQELNSEKIDTVSLLWISNAFAVWL